MLRSLLPLVLAGVASAALADGPGTRIRTGPPETQPLAAPEKDLQRCEALRDKAKERCLRELRAAKRADDRPPHMSQGPEGTGIGAGMGAGAGSGASTGAAPR